VRFGELFLSSLPCDCGIFYDWGCALFSMMTTKGESPRQDKSEDDEDSFSSNTSNSSLQSNLSSNWNFATTNTKIFPLPSPSEVVVEHVRRPSLAIAGLQPYDYSVDCIVQTLCGTKEAPSAEQIQRYLSVYHYFVSHVELLQLFMERFHSPKTREGEQEKEEIIPSIQLRVINIVKKWLELRHIELMADEEWMELYNIFLETVSKNEMQKQWSAFLRKRLEELSQKSAVTKPTLHIPLIPKLKLMKIKCKVIAEQMTFHESNLFRNIPLSSYSGKYWHTSKPALSFSERFNKTCYWVANEILNKKSRKEKVLTIVYFIKILQRLVILKNFNGAMEILTAFNFNAITRPLEAEWKSVPSKYMTALKEISDLLDPKNNYTRYRELLKQTTAPGIPFVALFLRDIIHEEEEPTFLDSGIVNNVKMHRISKILAEVIKFLPPEEQYKIEEDLTVTEYFNYQFKQNVNYEEIILGGNENRGVNQSTLSPHGREKTPQRSSLTLPIPPQIKTLVSTSAKTKDTSMSGSDDSLNESKERQSLQRSLTTPSPRNGGGSSTLRDLYVPTSWALFQNIPNTNINSDDHSVNKKDE